MPKEYKNLNLVEINYKCDNCGKDYYVHNGICLTSNPPQYPHCCPSCGDNKTFYCIYPSIEYIKNLNEPTLKVF